MKASDLRIGNWVYNNKDIEVDTYQIRNFSIGVYDLLPIPPTEEWLLKLGFINFKNESELYQCGFLSIDKDKDEFYYQAIKNHYQERAIRIDYVHQLQNLYFALTNEELTINESKEAND